MKDDRAKPQGPVVLLMGPTGAGKTDLALHLAARWPIDIVSVDSAMVYRGMNIGTGKPSPDVLRRFPHRLVDILDPAEAYSAGQFVRDARQAIQESHGSGRIPLLVGGTMLYFRALRQGLAELPTANPELRSAIDAEAAERGWPAMHAELARIDPVSAARIQPNDGQRIQRALEVFRLTGRTLTDFHAATVTPEPGLRFISYAWVPGDRDRLYDAIARRFAAMMEAGLLAEVGDLHRREDLHSRLPSIRSVGYRQLWEHLEGTVPLQQAITNAIVATRHLARRQLVWLRADADVKWIDALESSASALMEREIDSISNVRGSA
ncbi:tRNA dimethylallyltransferase [Povalibacter uvarum]|uniref:tRNA dimethylallyltransferase n=1 Tax=Povalibacter uvarum TaxID=732238 RepID=A0A841HEB2_9GAMM|nr:tRNA (adenosine(37)-N6)-dimethylallyltransferase MiaA [Povalibacter uvarum]MBB6091461.1 tRNA dimethylallyltransferase [Povalibacter uvarum]